MITCWVEHSLRKVFQDEGPSAHASRDIHLFAARNEREDAQICLRSGRGYGEVESAMALTATRRPDTDVVDNATALFRFRSDATGVLELSWTSPVNQMSSEIHGSEGALPVRAPGGALQIRRRSGETVEIPPGEFDPPGPLGNQPRARQ